jgi:hypothetical protein
VPATTWDISQTAAIIFIAGFAIQQALEIFSPFVDFYFNTWIDAIFNIKNPSDDDRKNYKKSLWLYYRFFLDY